MTPNAAVHRADMGWWVRQGAIGGVVAGIVFAVFEMVMTAILVGVDAVFMPLRMIGAIGLGPAALDPTYSLVTAAVAGVVIHLILSIVFGVVFAAIVAAVPALANTSASLIGAASVFGLVLWVVNFFVIAPLFGWNWFPNGTDAVVQFFAHTFFFGTVLGMYLDRASHGARVT